MNNESQPAKRRVDSYLETISRLESDISMCDRDATLTSIAISLKRIADTLETLPNSIQSSIQEAIWNATRK